MNRPWMPLYVADYRADTARLSAAEHGAYLLLIMEYWATGGLPDDDKQLARIACMTPREWKQTRPIMERYFQAGWKHKRIEDELAKAAEISSKRRAAAEQRHNKRDANADAKAHANADTSHSSQKERTEANASGADAPPDPRTKLFRESLQTLARMTGKTPDSCRSLVGKWLKTVDDEAIHVIAAIEDADRNRIADPVAWINQTLKPRARTNGQTAKDRSRDDFRAALGQLREFGDGEVGSGHGGDPVRLLPAAGRG